MRLDDADVALLIAVAIVLLSTWVLTHRRLRRDHLRNVRRYRVFAVRDELIGLVAEGVIDESDPVFRMFYESSVYFVNNTKKLTASRFAAALKEARKRGKDPAEKAKLDEILRGLRKQSPEVQAAVHRYFLVIRSIIIENSIILSLMERYRPAERCVMWLVGILQRRSAQQAYSYYIDYSHAARATA